MTTEETELTFVRCPNCRSLIPAIATRCRMCGAQFEKKADGETPAADPAASGKQSRVRQRTISATPDEVEQIKRDATSETPDAAFRLGGPSRREEVRREDVVPADEVSFDEPAAEESDMSTEDTFHSSAPAESADESIQFSEPAAEPEDDWTDDTDFGGDDDSFEDEEEGDGPGAEGGAGAGAPREGKRRRRRRRKKKNQGGADSQGTIGGAGAPVNPGASQTRLQQPPQQAQQEQPRHEAPRHEAPRHETPRHEPPRQEASRQEAPRQEPPRQEPARREPEQRFNEPRQAAVQEPRQASPGSPGPSDQPIRGEGNLAGWLVTFADGPRGVSTELRAGRFFVGRQKLRGNDFIVADSSVSTPHCMITAGAQDGLAIQDLMSENGTFIRRAGSDSFTPVQGTGTAHHGDTIRFGHYEMLVCLLPKGRAS